MDGNYTGQWSSIAIGADGLPIISYYDSSNGNLKVVHCGDDDCSSGNTITTLESSGVIGKYTSIAIGADGLPVISYWSDHTDWLKVVRCGNVLCNSGNTVTNADTADNQGEYTSIAIGADGLPIISYYNRNETAFKIQHCGNRTCSSGNNGVNVDNSADVGTHTSITIGADGLPIISYYDYTNADLKVAHCGTPKCDSGNVYSTLDSAGDIGTYTAITIGADGLPIISYYDATNGDLKVLKCSNPFCVPYFRRR